MINKRTSFRKQGKAANYINYPRYNPCNSRNTRRIWYDSTTTNLNSQSKGTAMPFYEKGPVRIHYEEFGSGFPLMIIPGGGLNGVISGLRNLPFDPVAEFKGEYRCIAADERNANAGQSSGPLEVDRPSDSYTDDHVGLMDHLGIDKFMVMGFCIGGPLVWNVLERATSRVIAAVLAQPSGWRPEMPTMNYDNNMTGWGPELVKRRPEITMEMV